MTPSLLLDITQIPTQLSGLEGLVYGMAFAMLSFLFPFTVVEMNVRGLQAGEHPSYSGLFTRVFAVVVCLLCYQQLFSFILNASQMMSFAILSSQDWGNFLTETLKGSDSTYPTLSILFHSVTSIQQIVLFLSSLLAVTVRDVLIMLQGCFLSLLYVFGPIAIVCGVNEKTSQVTRGWLVNSIQVALWSFFLRLVVRVWRTLGVMAGSTGAGLANDYLGILTVNVTFILMVLGTPVVAARLLSGENLAAFGVGALGTVQTLLIAKKMSVGTFASREVAGYLRAPPQEKRSFFHQPIPATMTATYDKLFGPPKPAGKVGKSNGAGKNK